MDRSINGSINQWINRSMDRSINGSINQWMDRSMDQSINGSINQWIDQSMDRSINGSIDQWIDQSMDQSINGLINQWINLSWLATDLGSCGAVSQYRPPLVSEGSPFAISPFWPIRQAIEGLNDLESSRNQVSYRSKGGSRAET